MAAEALNMPVQTLYSRVRAGGPCERLHGLSVNWSLGKRPAPEPDQKTEKPESAADPIEVRRLADKLKQAELARKSAERLAVKDQTIREALFQLSASPLDPPSFNPAPDKASGKVGEAIILPISDLHMGEVIDLEQMGGRNSYNERIARKRLERLFSSAVKLATVHWSGPPPSAIYVPLMGDLVSGEIHDELAKTNDLLAIPAVRALSEALIGGLDLLVRSFPTVPIHVVSVPGNHGRTTKKPEAKAFALNSYDTLVAWVIESWYAAKGNSRITFSAPASGDALVNIHGWNILFTHGDRIGSRGGAGFIGPAATAARGMQRIIQDYAAEGIIVDVIVIGHFHTPIELEQGFVNGTLAGPSEYSRAGRMRSHPASQWMISVHPTRGVARRWKIQVGHPSEGSIYKGRAI
jgi:predicted phosphodiesterase